MHNKRLNVYILLISMSFPLVPMVAFAQTNEIDKNSSIYRLNALENQISNININTKPEEIQGFNKIDDTVPVSVVVFNEQEDIAQKQKDSKEKVEASMMDINNNSKLHYFLIGSDLNILRFQSVQIQDQVFRLKVLSLEKNTDINQIQIDSQLATALAEKSKIDKFILEQSSKFSLFGWLSRII